MIGRVVRLAVAAGLTAYILWKSHPADVWAVLQGADWRLVLIAVGFVLSDRLLMAYRWIALLCIVDPADRPPLGALVRVFFLSTFLGTFLPASIGGDAVRAYHTARLNVRGGDAVASVFMDRMLGVVSIFLMALLGLVLARGLAANPTIVAGLALAGGASVGTLLVVFSTRAAAAVSALLMRLPGAAQRMGKALLDSIRRYSAFHPQLVGVLFGSIAVQILRIVQAYFLGRGLGIEAPLSAYFAFVPLILLVMLLPVTVNGIGTSQAAFVWFFAQAHVSSGEAFALSVLFVALGIVGNLPGALLYATGPARSTDGAL